MKKLLVLSMALALFLTACSGPVLLTSPSQVTQPSETGGTGILERGADYASLFTLIKKAQSFQATYGGRIYYKSWGGIMFRGAETAATADANKQNGSQDYSKTNIQVEGVDEADIIKTDGSYLYIIANNRLIVVDVQNPAAMNVTYSEVFTMSRETETVTTGEYPVEMFLDTVNNRLVLIISGWINEKQPITTEPSAEPASSEAVETKPAEAVTSESAATGLADEKMASRIWYPYYRTKQYTTTRIYDLTDKASLRMVRQFTQTGSYITSRKIESAVYVVTNEYKYNVYFEEGAEPKPADIFPATSENGDLTESGNWETLPPDKISILPQGDVASQMVLSAIDMADDDSKPDLLSVLGYSGTVYASEKYLYVAGYNYQWVGREDSQPVTSTDIFRFKLSGATVSEAGKGSVPGSILNQFSLDEHNGYFRIATTTYESKVVDENWVNTNKNHVYVLDQGLKVVGKVVDMAPGESIKSVRFMGDKVYVVTFRDVDPLFVIDLSSPSDPKILGQLKIPGYSTYLHPYDADKLLGFGYDVKSEGGNAYNMGLKVSLFDISDFYNPKELSTILLGGRGSSADILYNHKTLLFSREKNLIAFPASLTKTITQDPLEYGQIVFQGLLVLEVVADSQISLRGHVTHFDKMNDPDGEPVPLTEDEVQALYGFDSIARGAYIGQTLFTFSGRQVRSANLDTLEKIGVVVLPGYKEAQNYYYGIAVDDVVRAVE